LRVGTFISAVAFMALGIIGPASAAMTWRPEQTIELVRGISNPDVAIADNGYAALLYATANYRNRLGLNLVVRRPGEPEPFIPGARTSPAGSTDARVAMSPDGHMAVVGVDSGRLFVTTYGLSSSNGKQVEIVAPGVPDDPQIGIDATGRSTIVWTSPPSVEAYFPDSERRVYAVTVGPDAVAGAVQRLGEGGGCSPSLDVNLRGDAVVGVGCGGNPVFVRQAGGAFEPTDAPFEDPGGRIQVGIDGAGTVHATQASPVLLPSSGKIAQYGFQYSYAVRPRGGSFSVPQTIGPDGVSGFDLEVQDSGRVIAGWIDGSRFHYAFGAPGVSSLSPAKTIHGHVAARDVDVRNGGIDVVASPTGPVLLTWREAVSSSRERVVAALLGEDGTVSNYFRGIPGDLGSRVEAPSFAINNSGQVAGAWEQRCSVPEGGFAVMAVQRDLGGRPKDPPCQDRRAPKVIAVRKQASLSRHALRVRVACDEACAFTVRSRVLRAGARRPLALAKTSRERHLAERRGGWVSLRLSGDEMRRVRTALRARRKVTVRLAVSVRDRFGSGRTSRLRLPVRK